MPGVNATSQPARPQRRARLQAAAVGALLGKRLLPAAILFTLALNHKHMLLYFAPAFFSTMLGSCFWQEAPRSARARAAGAALPSKGALAWSLGGLRRVMQLGLVVLATCWFVWLPFVQDPAVAEQVRTNVFGFLCAVSSRTLRLLPER